MREIKFRAWDKQYKKMVKVTMALFAFDSMELLEIDTDDNLNEPKSIEHFEIMQYAGLKDKNGKEMYEGDIYDWQEGGIMKIVFRDGCFCLVKYETELSNYFPFMHWRVNEGEVIGNIYENPELLK